MMMEGQNINLDWMNEKVVKIKSHNFFYKFVCFFLFRIRRKITYKDLFILFYGLHRKKLGEEKSKKKALQTILKIYNENNGKYPYSDDK